MSQPILSLKSDEKSTKSVVNLLPCRVQHNGPIATISDYWNPTSAEGGSKTAYFRGRKLEGKSIKLPEKCRGVVVERRDEAPAETVETIEEGGDTLERVGSMHVASEFDEMIVWGHESLGDAAGDPYVRSMEEWLQVADQIHSYEQDANEKK